MSEVGTKEIILQNGEQFCGQQSLQVEKPGGNCEILLSALRGKVYIKHLF